MMDTRKVIKAYFARIESGTATAAEYEILPQMLDRYEAANAKLTDADIAMLDGMSEAGRHGKFPAEGLISAAEAAEYVGKVGLKKPAETLRKLARDGRFPKPVRVGGVDMWDIAELRAWRESLKGGAHGSAVPSRISRRRSSIGDSRGVHGRQDSSTV